MIVVVMTTESKSIAGDGLRRNVFAWPECEAWV